MINSTAPQDEISLLRQKAESAKLPPPVRDRAATQIDRLAGPGGRPRRPYYER